MSEALEILERAAFTDAEMRAYDKFWDEVSSLRTIEGDWEDKLKETEAKAEKAVAEAEAEPPVSPLRKSMSYNCFPATSCNLATF